MTTTLKEGLDKSWIINATAWTRAVRDNKIESRRLVTDAAIVEAIQATSPGCALDVGCGEDWLVRTLKNQGIEAVGVDASAPLIQAARTTGIGSFFCIRMPNLLPHRHWQAITLIW